MSMLQCYKSNRIIDTKDIVNKFKKQYIFMDSRDIINFAQSVISTEVEAIAKLATYIDDTFVEVVQLISSLKGRVVVTGIGKSAIIGSKIVATLNSTGTPAIFMHAADAIHGDLGIIQAGDVVICISKSGNTPEIKVLIPLIRNIGSNKIVGMVGSSDSFLAQSSDYVLSCHVNHEACPHNLAPTSSTTAQLVMGDALAMTLLESRGFSSEDFAKVHPGGALGKRLYLRVADMIKCNAMPKVATDTPIDKVLFEISSKRLGAAVVLDGDEVVGIITDGDIRRMLERKVDIGSAVASDIMTPNPKSISDSELAVRAFSIMEKKKITQLVVVDGSGSYLGIIHIHDILREGVV